MYCYQSAEGLGAASRSRSFTQKEKLEGAKYLAQQYADQAYAAQKANVRIVKPAATKTRDGKADVKISSVWSEWNREGAKAVRPVAAAIRNFELLPRAMREKLLTRPLDAIIDIFDPVMERIAAPCTRTMNKHLRGGRRVEWFGKYLDIRIQQPVDDKFDASTKNILRKLRTIQAFIICFIKKPLELAGECIKEGIDLVSDVGNAVGNAVGKAVDALGNSVATAMEEAGKATAGIAAAVGGFFGLQGVGDDGLGTTGGVGEGAILAGSVPIFGIPIQNSLILGVITAIVGAATTLGVVAMQTGSQKEVALAALKVGQTAGFTTTLPDGTKTTFKSGFPPQPVPPGAIPDALDDNEDPATLVRSLSMQTGDKDKDKDEGKAGFPVLPVLLGVGVLAVAFSMSRK